MATRYYPGMLILFAPFTSLTDIALDISWMGTFMPNQFKNKEIMELVTSPTLFIHGIKDEIIHYKHSIRLCELCNGPKELALREDMTHEKFKMKSDVIDNILNFAERINFRINKSYEFLHMDQLMEIVDSQHGNRSLSPRRSPVTTLTTNFKGEPEWEPTLPDFVEKKVEKFEEGKENEGSGKKKSDAGPEC